jgi:hypothetical protein
MLQHREVDLSDTSLFRREALEARSRRVASRVEPVRLWVVPRWVRRAYRLLVALAGASLAAGWYVTVDEYVAGPAVVRLEEGGRCCIVEGTLTGVRPAGLGAGTLAIFRPHGAEAPAREIALGPISIRRVDPLPDGASAAAQGPSVRLSIDAPFADSATGAELPCQDGLVGTLEVTVGSRRALTLLPGVRNLVGRGHER